MDQLPTNISALTEQQIKESGAQTLDQVLNLLPAVDVQRSGTLGAFSTVRLRGVPSSAQVQIVVDDQPLGGVSTQFVDASQIPVENIERVEVVRGGSSVLYGTNTIGGVIHIITKKRIDEKPSVGVGFQAGSFGAKIYKAEAGGVLSRFDGFATVSHYRTDGFQQNSEAKNTTGTGAAGYSFPNGARISVDLL
jgi:outer membrane cobalamin receptor